MNDLEIIDIVKSFGFKTGKVYDMYPDEFKIHLKFQNHQFSSDVSYEHLVQEFTESNSFKIMTDRLLDSGVIVSFEHTGANKCLTFQNFKWSEQAVRFQSIYERYIELLPKNKTKRKTSLPMRTRNKENFWVCEWPIVYYPNRWEDRAYLKACLFHLNTFKTKTYIHNNPIHPNATFVSIKVW